MLANLYQIPSNPVSSVPAVSRAHISHLIAQTRSPAGGNVSTWPYSEPENDSRGGRAEFCSGSTGSWRNAPASIGERMSHAEERRDLLLRVSGKRAESAAMSLLRSRRTPLYLALMAAHLAAGQLWYIMAPGSASSTRHGSHGSGRRRRSSTWPSQRRCPCDASCPTWSRMSSSSTHASSSTRPTTAPVSCSNRSGSAGRTPTSS